MFSGREEFGREVPVAWVPFSTPPIGGSIPPGGTSVPRRRDSDVSRGQEPRKKSAGNPRRVDATGKKATLRGRAQVKSERDKFRLTEIRALRNNHCPQMLG